MKSGFIIATGLLAFACTRPPTTIEPDATAFSVDGRSTLDVGISDRGTAIDVGEIDPDAQVEDASLGPVIEVGTGTQMFEVLQAGDRLPFILGPQGGGRHGGYHLWMAIRSRDFRPDNIDLTVSLLDGQNRTVITTMSQTLTLPRLGDYYGLTAIRLMPPDCCAVVNADLVLHTQIVDRDQKRGTGEIAIVGGDRCPDLDDRNICP